MATDNTPPRLRLIVTIAIIVVITLVGVDFVLKSYYAFMSDEAQREKLAPLTARNEQRTAEQASFAGAKLPIDQAMTQVGQQVTGTRNALIEPKPSEDMAAMTGWSKLPKQPPLPAPAGHGPTIPMGHETMVAGDAGAALAGDAGVAGDAGHTPRVAAEAGAPGHAPPGHAPDGHPPTPAPAPAPAPAKDAGAHH